jgi:hypothetical protein
VGHYVVLLVVMSLSVTSLAMPALAQSQVERGPAHARSICSYSGLNDEPVEGGRTRSYGQEVKRDYIEPSAVKSGPPGPGFFCNPKNLSLKGRGAGTSRPGGTSYAGICPPACLWSSERVEG